MSKNSKDGVAVIVVMGILALLMVLAVSFAVTMRVERAGAANYTTAVNSRQLAWAALSRAITDINVSTPGFYPDGDFLVSRDAGVAWNSNGVGGVMLAIGRIRDYIPGVLQPVADSAVSEWIRLRPDEGMGGHVAYLVLNVSDLLDVNAVGGSLRGGGTNTSEVVLSGFSPSIDTNILVEARHQLAGTGGFSPYEGANRYPFFESLAELRLLAPAVPADVFVDYSRFLPDQYRPAPVSIGGTTNELVANQAAIMNQILLRTLYPSAPVERPGGIAVLRQIFNNLLDYIDEDSIPRSLSAPNGEAVPLLNEIAIQGSPLMGPGAFAGQLRLETWFPFATPSRFGHSFSMRYQYSVAVTVAEPGSTNTYRTASNVVSSAFSPAPMSFRTTPSTFRVPISWDPTNSPTFTINIGVSNLAVTLSGSGAIVDAATNGVLNFSYTGPYVLSPGLSPRSYQATDPRLNWRTSDWTSSDTPTLGTTNAVTLDYWDSNPSLSRGFPLYVADRGFLFSPLELGNLLIPGPSGQLAPWSTFRVLQQGAGAPRHPLLERFYTTPVATNAGLVNINSQDPAILAAAFRNMPHPYGEEGDPVLSNVDASAAASIITDARASGTTFTNVTDILDLDWRSGHFSGRSDLDLEAMLAYATGLMGVRQNLFLILAAGSAGEEAMGVRGYQTVRTQARKTAVALVWRDPLPNAEGRHECFLKFFRWIDD